MLHVVFSQDLHFKNCILLSTLQCRYSSKLTSQLENREDDLKFLFKKSFVKLFFLWIVVIKFLRIQDIYNQYQKPLSSLRLIIN